VVRGQQEGHWQAVRTSRRRLRWGGEGAKQGQHKGCVKAERGLREGGAARVAQGRRKGGARAAWGLREDCARAVRGLREGSTGAAHGRHKGGPKAARGRRGLHMGIERAARGRRESGARAAQGLRKGCTDALQVLREAQQGVIFRIRCRSAALTRYKECRSQVVAGSGRRTIRLHLDEGVVRVQIEEISIQIQSSFWWDHW
jgi:hypothetical protein